jgi:hypothetical protein
MMKRMIKETSSKVLAGILIRSTCKTIGDGGARAGGTPNFEESKMRLILFGFSLWSRCQD